MAGLMDIVLLGVGGLGIYEGYYLVTDTAPPFRPDPLYNFLRGLILGMPGGGNGCHGTCTGNTHLDMTTCTCVPNTGGGTPGLKYTYSYKFGTKGNGNGQFQDPHDVSFDRAGNVFVNDRVRSDIQVFTHAGKFIKKFGGPGSGNGQFNVPYAIQHTPDFNYIYVADRENNRIQKLDANGNYISKITAAGGKNFNKPEDVIFDPVDKSMYICDTGNERIVKFDKNHKFLLQWGKKGSANGQFDHPHSSDVGLDRNVYISSGNQGYIQVFSPTGQFLRKFSKPGTHDGELLTFLEHLDIDIFGRLHIVNNNLRPIVSVFECSTGKYLTKYGSPEHEGSANGQFREPEHVTTDATGKSFVVDAKNQRIQVFTPNMSASSYAKAISYRNPI